MIKLRFNIKGQSLVEVLIAVGIAAIFVGGVISVHIVSLRANANTRLSVVGSHLAQDAYDVIEAISENNWHLVFNLLRGTNYRLHVSGGNFNFVQGIETIEVDGVLYSRSFVVENIYRDTAGNIVPVGTLDPSTQRLIVTVSWPIMGTVSQVRTTGHIARNRNATTQSTNWEGGATGGTGSFTGHTSNFTNSDNIDFSTSGIIRVLNF